jgi:hypothetical protein
MPVLFYWMIVLQMSYYIRTLGILFPLKQKLALEHTRWESSLTMNVGLGVVWHRVSPGNEA